jgi:hypothetical protein
MSNQMEQLQRDGMYSLMEGASLTLMNLDQSFSPRLRIQSAYPFDWILYPRFHLRVELFPADPFPAAYYTLTADELLTNIHWTSKDLPQLDTWDASGMTGEDYTEWGPLEQPFTSR